MAGPRERLILCGVTVVRCVALCGAHSRAWAGEHKLGISWRPKLQHRRHQPLSSSTRSCSARIGIVRVWTMDSPILTQLFRQLFSHRSSRCLARRPYGSLWTPDQISNSRRHMATRRTEGETRNESKWVPRQHVYPSDRTEEFSRYPMVTANMLRSRRERPKRVKMLLRDFIEG